MANKLALITGATSGIGKSCAIQFAKNGIDLIITGRREERLIELKSQLEKEHFISVQTLTFDVRNREQTTEVLNSVSDDDKNRTEYLINNAGLAVGVSPIDQGSFDDWDRMIDTNVTGLLNVSRIVIPWMTNKKSGHILNIGSIAGKEVYPNGNVYCASKHAVDALSRGMRLDLVGHGIKVSNIAPGLVETEFSNVRFYGDQEKADAVYAGMDPLTGDDIADAVWYCASRPAHVNIGDILILPSHQASSTVVVRK